MAVKKQEEEKKKNSGSILKGILNKNQKEHYNYQERVNWEISSGSLLLDSAVGSIKPSFVRLCGYSNEGKSAAALEICRNFLNGVPYSKAIWVIAEGRGLSEEHVNRSGLTFVFDPEEWVDGTIFVFETNVYNLVIDTIKDLVLDNSEEKRFCFIIDSFDSLRIREDENKDITDSKSKIAGAPSMSKRLFTNLSLAMFKYGHLMIGLSQVSTDIKIDPYSKVPGKLGTFSGGKALEHFADLVLEFQQSFPSDFIIDGEGRVNDGKSKAVGKNVKIMVQKTTIETARKSLITYPIKFKRRPSAVWVEREIVDLLIAYGIAVKPPKGAWYSIDEETQTEWKQFCAETPDKFQGVSNFYNFIEENPKLRDYLFTKLKNMMLENDIVGIPDKDPVEV